MASGPRNDLKVRPREFHFKETGSCFDSTDLDKISVIVALCIRHNPLHRLAPEDTNVSLGRLRIPGRSA